VDRLKASLGVLLAAALLWLLGGWLILGGPPHRTYNRTPTVVLHLLLRPSSTPTLTPTPWPSPTFTPSRSARETGGIAVGQFVQVQGTQGLGLRVREGPGLQRRVLFLARETEVFRVVDGPVEADGHVWWYLAAPYAESRRGWAVQDFLQVLPLTPTPPAP